MSARPLASLGLRPRSRPAQRIWRVGRHPVENVSGTDDLWLVVRRRRHESFSALDEILRSPSVRPFVDDGDLGRLEGYLRECDVRRDDELTHGGFLADSVTFAIMRRVSRESVYTARAIDLGARLLNDAFSRSGFHRVHVGHVDRLDRPSLKVLARCLLLLQPEQRFAWVWHSEGDPTAPPEVDGLFGVSRSRLLNQLVELTAPRIESGRKEVGPRAGDRRRRDAPPAERAIAAALVVQNYDACFLWGERRLQATSGADRGETLRLLALAAANIGETEAALRILVDAEASTSDPCRRAHLCYLSGLLEAKRAYDLKRSDAQYRRGLGLLENASRGDAASDRDLERAWLQNGLALNEAVRWRRSRADVHREQATGLVRSAFELVREGASASRAYLRFNLLANLAFLMEMDGRFDVAIELLSRTFDADDGDDSSIGGRNARAFLAYRLGVLHSRSGNLEHAEQLLREASAQVFEVESWATRERILRALGAVLFDRGELDTATAAFETGLSLCEAARGLEGTIEHGRGLFATLVARERSAEAGELHERLLEEEGLDLFGGSDPTVLDERCLPSPPATKLPPYIPEIDLEDTPAVDLNRFLGGALSHYAKGADPWKR